MNIDKSKLYTCWYEDEDGNRVPAFTDYNDNSDTLDPNKTWTYHSAFPCVLSEQIDTFTPNLKYTDNKWLIKHFPKKYGHTFTRLMTGESSWNPICVEAMVKSGDFTLPEAIMVYANSCGRCINVLWNKYVGKDEGYPEYSEEWNKCHTSCRFCGNCQTDVVDTQREIIKELCEQGNCDLPVLSSSNKITDDDIVTLSMSAGCPFKTALSADIFEDVINNCCDSDLLGGMCNTDSAQKCWRKVLKIESRE